MPDLAARGINTDAARVFYYWQGAWREVGEGLAIKDDEVILPDMYLWVRNLANQDAEVLMSGVTLTTNWRMAIQRDSSVHQDSLFALPRPFAVSLNDSGLIQSGAFLPSPSPVDRLDELLTFDNTAPGQNKSAAATYYYSGGAWRKVGEGTLDVGNDFVFQPGSGFIIRAGSGEHSAVWTNGPNQ
jgi:uncharacterized protein (TIGR02597 family)